MKEERVKKKENEIFSERLKTEKIRLEKEIQQQLEKSIATDFENKIKQLEANNAGAEIKLKEAREKELIFLQKEKAPFGAFIYTVSTASIFGKRNWIKRN